MQATLPWRRVFPGYSDSSYEDRGSPRLRPVRLQGSRRRQRSNRSNQQVDFFFPDSQDQIDPSFDFGRETSSPDRVRQRDDRYAHEVISPPPYTGVLLSKALIDGPGSKYTFAQRHRLYRLGVRRFFRLDESDGPPLATLMSSPLCCPLSIARDFGTAGDGFQRSRPRPKPEGPTEPSAPRVPCGGRAFDGGRPVAHAQPV